LHQFQEQSEAMQRNPHSYQIATGYRTFYSLSLIYQPITKKRLFLRKTSIDELPQIFNVLLGDMSFVGPRPSPMGNENTYTDFIRKKFGVRPGITGYNQALKRNSATLEERYRNDVYYAEHVSFLLDCRIIIMTLKSVLRRENVYKN